MANDSDQPEQGAVFDLQTDEEGSVWISGPDRLFDDRWMHKLGARDAVIEKLSQWLAEQDDAEPRNPWPRS